MYNDLFMQMALEEAKKAYNKDEVPVGAVIVYDNKVISKCHNNMKKKNNITNHAEIDAIIEASRIFNDWRLNDCEMYVTLEPCPMCAGAILNSRIKKIYIGAKSNINSNKMIVESILQNSEYYHFVDVEYVDNKEASIILSEFFNNKRGN